MTYCDLQSCRIGEVLQLDLPQAHPIAIAATTICTDQQLIGVGIGWLADAGPPALQTGDRETGCILILPDGHPASVAPHIVDAVWDGFSHCWIRKIVDVDHFGITLRLPFLARIAELPDQFFLLGVDRHDWQSLRQEGFDLV